MRRRLSHLALLLVLGAVINYALAMGIIWFNPVREPDAVIIRFHGVPAFRFESIGMTRVLWMPFEPPGYGATPGTLPAWSRIHRLPRPAISSVEWFNLPAPLEHEDVAAGWPLRSMRYEYDNIVRGQRTGELIIRSGIELPPQQGPPNWGTYPRPRAIPLRILPLGFVINTALFASLAAIVWLMPSTVRRIRRRRANRCLKCGYARAGLAAGAVCPECGTDLQGKRQRDRETA